MKSEPTKPCRRKSATTKESGSRHEKRVSDLDILAGHQLSASAAIEPAILYGERQARFVSSLLSALLRTAKQRGFTIEVAEIPPAVLLEFAALMQLRIWEQAGIAPESLDLPSSHEALRELGGRIQRDKSQFQRLDAASLEARVATVWFQRFAWNAPILLDADVVGGDLKVDDAVEAMAQLLWRYRNHSTLQPEKG
jgi:hypothetical protein